MRMCSFELRIFCFKVRNSYHYFGDASCIIQKLIILDMAALLASGFLPGAGGLPPELLATLPGMKPEKGALESSRSPSRSSTPSRASPSVNRHSKNPPSDASQLTGEERVTVVNFTTGKKVKAVNATYCSITHSRSRRKGFLLKIHTCSY